MSCATRRHPEPAAVAMPATRFASVADAAMLATIDACGQINPWCEEQFAAMCSGSGAHGETVLVATEEDAVVGYVVFALVLEEASVHRIAVHKAHRGRGCGQRLLAAAMAHMQRAGATRCLLEVRQSNAVARRLYEANGFSLDGVRKNYYPSLDGREDALLMSRNL